MGIQEFSSGLSTEDKEQLQRIEDKAGGGYNKYSKLANYKEISVGFGETNIPLSIVGEGYISHLLIGINTTASHKVELDIDGKRYMDMTLSNSNYHGLVRMMGNAGTYEPLINSRSMYNVTNFTEGVHEAYQTQIINIPLFFSQSMELRLMNTATSGTHTFAIVYELGVI